MKQLNLFILSILLLLPFYSYAQNEASTWYMANGYGIKFLDGTAKTIKEGPENTGTTHTYSNLMGQVQLYVNGDGIFNKNGVLMQNGNWNHKPVTTAIYIIPKPGSSSLYYIFYVKSTLPGDYSAINQAVMYAVVDLTAENGKGKVLEKDKILYKDLHGFFTVSGRCDKNVFWLVGETNTNISGIGSDTFLAFKISEAGISNMPVRSVPVNIGNSNYLKFSPKGDKIVFNHSGGYNQEEGVGLANFNTTTGEVSKYIRLEENGWSNAFSASGNKLYLSGNFRYPNIIWQFDLSSGNEQEILASKTRVYFGPKRLWQMQLAPDGKIYLNSTEDQKSLAAINYPERTGTACEVTLDAIVFPKDFHGLLPAFAESFMYDYPVKADAGPDKEICQGQQVQLGGSYDSKYTYRWEPDDYLSNPNAPNPTFKYLETITEKQELTYTLYVNDGACERADNVMVTVLPTPRIAGINGSKSVCPGVVDVDYSVDAQEGYTYRWVVTGGQLTSGQGTAAIKVNWGPSNPGASVSVTARNTFGCESAAVVLPVRINVELKPEVPQGTTTVCLNQAAGNNYSVTNTTGSHYIWGINGGHIVAGQGSNRVTINWQGIGNHKLWIQEQSTTVDTVCFGVSDTLHVSVFKDQTAIDLNFISITTEEGNEGMQQWQVSSALSPEKAIAVYRRTYGSGTWNKIASVPTDVQRYADTGIGGRDDIYEYKVVATNNCDEVIESSLHRTIRLQGHANMEQDNIALNWNAYEGWVDGVAFYEIWGRIDNAEEYTLLQKVDGSTLTFSGIDAVAGFHHNYRIKATAVGTSWSSWSNSVSFDFEHALSIPNIFTPNGDSYNDTFAIPKLELYPDNELVIVNRLGNEVYRRKGYQGTWNGGNVTAGLYNYQLYIKKLNRYYKGWVEIVN